jgi:uncharacterized protein (TIGR00369 family)
MMKKVNPSYVEAVKELANESPFFRHLSMTISDMGIGYATVQLEVKNNHLQAFGFVHGGVYSAVIDTAAFWAVFCELEEGAGITSVDLKVNYLAPVKEGRLVAEGKSIKLGKSLGLAEAKIFDNKGKLVAYGSSTLIVIPGFSLADNPDLPHKFVV